MAYPAPIKDGDNWMGIMRVTHQGPAEEIVVSFGVKVADAPGGFEWLTAPAQVGDDSTPKTYELAVTPGVFESFNLSPGAKIDTVLVIQNKAQNKTLAYNTSTSRFVLMAAAIEEKFTITADRYFTDTADWQEWNDT